MFDWFFLGVLLLLAFPFIAIVALVKAINVNDLLRRLEARVALIERGAAPLAAAAPPPAPEPAPARPQAPVAPPPAAPQAPIAASTSVPASPPPSAAAPPARVGFEERVGTR